MGDHSSIEWTEATWNPVTGCTKISQGCKNCYAEKLALRLQAMGQANYRNGFEITLQPQQLHLPLVWKRPKRVFVNSMSDLFHDEVPASFIEKVFSTMNAAAQHQFQVLTKRAERLAQIATSLPWGPNIWMGVSVENCDHLDRISFLRQTGAAIKFLSLEPLLGPLKKLDLTGIDWVIVGGESGHKARPMSEEWVLDIYEKCREFNTPFFFKQWGGRNKKRAGRTLNGRTYDEFPVKISE